MINLLKIVAEIVVTVCIVWLAYVNYKEDEYK